MSEENAPDALELPRADSSDTEQITIYINRHPFRIARKPIIGATIMGLPTPPIGSELDLIRITHGNEPDLFVRPDEVVELEDGSEFFAVPRTVNAGYGGA
jgi:hypothetical protein